MLTLSNPQLAVSHGQDKGLLGGVRVNRAQAAEVTRIQRLKEVEGLGTAYFPEQDAIGSMPQRCPEQIRNGYRGEWRFLAEWNLRATCFKPQQVRLDEMNFGRLFDQDDTIVVWNA